MHVGIALDYTLFIQLGIFLVFMLIMNKIYLQPYLQGLTEREETVKSLLEVAEKNNLLVQEILKEVEEILNKGKVESDKILNQAHHETNQIVAEILRKAQEDAEKEIQSAKVDIDRVLEIEKKALNVAVQRIAEKIVEKITLKEKAA